MARAALEEGLFPSVGSLARSLQQRLRSAGVSYDVRTLKRQMLGTIATVPTEVQFTISGLLPNGIRVDAGAPPYVMAAKVPPLVQLWLHLNPGSSRRALASRLQRDLEKDGISYTVDSLQAVLAGKNRHFVRTAIQDRLSANLGECGFTVGSDAKGPIENLSEEISRSLAMRELVPIRRFRELCLLWMWEHHGASPRRLSTILHEKLLQRGVPMNRDYLHRAVSGVPRRVRRLLQTVLEESLQAEFPRPRDLDAALVRTANERARLKLDMVWVPANPIVALAKAWLGQHPASSMRQLALGLAAAIQRMGYSMSHNSIQPILAGWKNKTRRFVYRAITIECSNIKCATRACVFPAARNGLCRMCWLRTQEPGRFERTGSRQAALW